MRKKIRIFTYLILPITLLAIFFFFPTADKLFRLSGRTAIYLLFVIMFIKPLAVFINLPILHTLLGYRRELGHASIWFFLFHMSGMIYTWDLLNINYFTNPTSFLFWGGLAAIGMIILLFISNNIGVKILKKNWKRIQRISYLVFFFALIHISMTEGEFEEYFKTFAVILFYLVLKYFEYKKFHKKPTQITNQKTDN